MSIIFEFIGTFDQHTQPRSEWGWDEDEGCYYRTRKDDSGAYEYQYDYKSSKGSKEKEKEKEKEKRKAYYVPYKKGGHSAFSLDYKTWLEKCS